ncbi:MAG: PAS domain S-box protein [Corynebacterium sp.]|uniref:PAS domain-containing protein n=1 Tax=Corynebacterium sp. TaxID=1720 RepID=UPI0026DF0CB4|nr:PAS domain S-box protein [Corynebacterium sp.]MDO5668450.1 PAS domain S-box protein [Corynebacterium sp.]
MNPDKIAERIVADSPDAIIYCDRTGTIQLWNAGAERIFGWTSAEAIGENLDIIIPEKYRDVHWKGWERVMVSGETRYGAEPLAVPGLHKDGSAMSLEFSIMMLHDVTGDIQGIAAIMRDVSVRWAREKELRARVRELESQNT